ncbi:MAG: hypothetical protein M1828_002162 [Chrysothrix sp. TS-e1954]|nr:MAG: hypothetical protein M1828_002162 [Chrysothrix sp. TS-e1954]
MESLGSHFGFVDPGLLEKIDKLFACNVGEYVDLPQLVVVGDQSSGKSSVLEALTKLPFPRESSLCTRFATQIIFRRSQEARVTVSVIPAQDASKEHEDAVRAWTVNDLRSIDAEPFAKIVTQVNGVMGLEPDASGSKSTFSNDVLRLEIAGPKEDHLSVIDVPGIFKRTTAGETTKSDMEMVEYMVHGYMSNSRSVMLAVVPANVDIATQEILEKAEELDPDGIRTLGVLTKPDLVDEGAEKNVIDLVEGRKHELRLGWHVLRNASQAELNKRTTDRDIAERRFFADNSPWNSLGKERVGIASFKDRLQEILTNHIRREFPKVKSEVAKKLRSCQQNLQALGAKRQTPTEQIKYLTGISMEFHKLVEEALASSYSRADVFDEKPRLRLATAVVNRGELMSEVMATKGHAFNFESSDMDKGAHKLESYTSSVSKSSDVATTKLDDHEPEKTFEVRQLQCHFELEDVVHVPERLPEPRDGSIYTWLEEVYYGTRGFEIGTLNPALLAVTMKRQSKKWKSLALGYMADVVTLAHTFVMDLLSVVCPVVRVQRGVMSLLMDHLREKYRSAMTHTKFLLEVELDGTPATLNHYFNENLEKCQYGEVVRVEDIMQSRPTSNADHDIQDLHDILKSYYKVARKRFVDSLRMQAADYYLITGPKTPLKLFSPELVAGMTLEQLEEVAGEDLIIKRRRAQLKKEQKDLEDGKKILS